MSELELSGLVVGIAAMLFFTPFCMAKGISRMDGELSIKEYILCAIPIFNIIRAEIKYWGKIHAVTLSWLLLIVGIVQRYFLLRYMYNNVTVGTISIIVFWAVIAFYFIANMIFVFSVIHDANAVTGFKLFLLTVGYPFGQYYVGAYLANVVRHMQEREETFKQ